MSRVEKLGLDFKTRIFREATPTTRGNKLPKRFWEKGKSKFVDIRLHEEGLFNINQLHLKYQKLEKKYRSWWFRLIQMISRLLRIPELTENK